MATQRNLYKTCVIVPQCDIMDVVVSDLHIGSLNSTFSSSTGEDVTKQFIKELKDTDSVEKVILLGDIFDFWEENLFKALRKSAFFFEQISHITDEIVYIPGNHDHHSLVLCKEMELIGEMEKGAIPGPSFRDVLKYEYPRKNSDFVETQFLDGFFTALQDAHIQLFYPEYTYKWKGKEILFRHGHYLDSGLLRVLPYFYECLGGKIRSEIDFETVNTPIYEFLYYSGTIKELSSFYKVLHRRLYKYTEKFYKRRRHKTIENRKGDIQKFFSTFKKEQQPDVLVFGHTHIADKGILHDTDLFNSGCWVREENILHSNTYITIADEIEVREVSKGTIL